MDVPIQHPWLRRPLLAPWFPTRLFDQRFGEGLPGPPVGPHWAMGPPGPGSNVAECPEAGFSELRLDKDRFSVLLDVQHFAPEELSVKVVGDYVEVHAKHEERPDEHGYVSREFHRRYLLPTGVDGATVTSALSPDGILTITAPMHPPGPTPEGRNVPIARPDAPK